MLRQVTHKKVELGWDLDPDEGESRDGHVRMYSNGEGIRPDGFKSHGLNQGI